MIAFKITSIRVEAPLTAEETEAAFNVSGQYVNLFLPLQELGASDIYFGSTLTFKCRGKYEARKIINKFKEVI